jgi:hypothetical protein
MKNYFAKFLSAVCLGATLSCAFAGPQENAETAYIKGNYSEALKIITPLATKGEAWAQFNLGLMFENGLGVSIDSKEGLKWFNRAALQGHTEATTIIRLQPLASLLNRVLFADGLMGLSGLVESCYFAPKARGYDCLILDIGSMYLESVPASRNILEFFSSDAHITRVDTAISKGDLKLEDAKKVQQIVSKRMMQALSADLKLRESIGDAECIVIDPDIATNFSGECVNGYAEGYGVAKARDEYRGEFKRGLVHGRGQYTHGADSKWSTEVFRGSYFKGAKNGFGVLSISANSSHPALDSMKKNGTRKEGRYFYSAIYSVGRVVFTCKDEDECLNRLPTIEFNEVLDEIKFGSERIDFDDLRKLTNLSILKLGRSQIFSNCMIDEIFLDYFENQAGDKKLERNEIKIFYKYLSNKKLMLQPYLYCLQK